MRRTLLTVVAAMVAVLVSSCAGDDGGAGDSATTTSTAFTLPLATSPTLPADVADSFDAVDADALCADLRSLADIDPAIDPTQAGVDRIRTVARTAPSALAEALETVARLGEAGLVGEPEEALATEAAGAALLVVAYGNDVCGGLDVALFDDLSGYG